MDQITLATAGHVDHGKTTLVKRLSGVDTDTTAEEKRRGLTINLGFTFFQLNQDTRVGIVDVPGHKKFLKNMLAGLAGVDMVLLVVDVNEGVMPQTIEHASILRLLGIENFIIVLTKVDGASPDMIELASQDIRESFRSDPFLSQAPIIATDALADIGIKDLTNEIEKMLPSVAVPKDYERPRMNVDRVFSVKGIGTIVTGTLLDGKLHIGDSLKIFPSEERAKIKNIQVYDGDTNMALPGQRTALNLTVPKTELSRGDVIGIEAGLHVTDELNLSLQTLALPNKKITVNEQVEFYVGANEVIGRLFPLGADEIPENSHGFVQIRLDRPVAVKHADPFILRSFSTDQTIGGGKILVAKGITRKRFDQAQLETLRIRDTHDLPDIIKDYLVSKRYFSIDVRYLSEQFNVSLDEIKRAIDELVKQKYVSRIDNDKLILENEFNVRANDVTDVLTKYHRQYPLRMGMTTTKLEAQLENIPDKSERDLLLQLMVDRKKIKRIDTNFAIPTFKPTVSTNDKQLSDKITTIIGRNDMVPTKIVDINSNISHVNEVVDTMSGTKLVRLDAEYVISNTAYQKIFTRLKDFATKNDVFSLADYRDVTETSRKFAMLVLEKMDKDGLTVRIENKRRIKKGEQ